MSIDWILVADRGHARILHCVPDVLPKYITIASFDHPESREAAHDAETDAPGRIQLRGASRSAVEPHVDRAHVTAQHFATELLTYLDHACREGRFERLFVVAPPLFLGTLRASYNPHIQKRIAGEVSKDFSGLSDAQLQSHLTELLTTVPA